MCGRFRLGSAVSLASVTAVLITPGSALADRCSGVDPARIVFCDDFDRHCTMPPPDPADACPLGSTADLASLYAIWPLQATCSISTSPISLTTNNMWKPDGYAANVGFNIPQLPTHVATLPGPVNGSGPGTEANPDSLKGQYFLHVQNTGAFANFVILHGVVHG